MECPLFLWYRHCFLRSAFSGLDALLSGGISLALRASSRILPLSAIRGVYLENWLPELSLLLSPRLADRPWRSFSSFPFSLLASARAWLRKSLSSSNYMYLAALFLSSSKPAVDCMQRLSANGPGHKVVSMWCMATSGLRFRMLIATLSNLSTKVLKDSPFSGGYQPGQWRSGGAVGSGQTASQTWTSASQSCRRSWEGAL